MKSFKAAVSLGLAARVLSIGARFLSVPLTVALLSKEKYGLWLIASSIVGWLAVSDLGMPAALQNRLIHLLWKKEDERAKSLVGFALRLLGCVGLAIGLIGFAGAIGVPWGKLFPISEGLRPEFTATLCLCAFGFALGLPTRIGVVIYTGNGQLKAAPLTEIAAQSASLMLLLVAVALKWNSLLALCACTLAGVALGPLVATITACRRFGYTISSPTPVDPEDRKALLGKGLFFAVAAVGELLILQSDSVIIGSRLGPEVVPSFAIPATLFINFLQLQNIYLRPLWPLITAAAAEDNRQQLSLHFRKAVLICGGGATVFALGLILIGNWFVKHWSKGLVDLPLNMAIGFGVYSITAAVDSLCATFLNAAGKIEYRCGYTLLFGVIKAVAAVALIATIGVSWLPLLFAAVMIVSSLPFGLFGIRQSIRRDLSGNLT